MHFGGSVSFISFSFNMGRRQKAFLSFFLNLRSSMAVAGGHMEAFP